MSRDARPDAGWRGKHGENAEKEGTIAAMASTTDGATDLVVDETMEGMEPQETNRDTTQDTPQEADSPETSASNTASSIERQRFDAWIHEMRELATWADWANRWADRKQPESVTKLIPRVVENPLTWSLPSSASEEGSEETERLIHALAELRRKPSPAEQRIDWTARVRDWCEHAAHCTTSEVFAVECLAWAHALPRLVTRVEQEVWLGLVSVLFERGLESVSTPIAIQTQRDALIGQMLGGELALTLTYQFPKFEFVTPLLIAARHRIAEGLIELLDGEGVLRADCVYHWRCFLGCWTRCIYLDRELPGSPISKEARLQFEWLVRQTLRLRHGEGRLVFEQLTAQLPSVDSLLRAALSVGGDRLDEELFAIAVGRKKESSSTYELPPAGEHSEWAEASVLRNRWTPDATYLGVTFHESKFRSELGIGALRLWWGESMPEVRIDGTKLESADEWEEVCWETDESGQYLELEMQLTDGWKLQRQLYLPKKDGFLFVADAVIGEGRAAIDYRSTLPWSTAIRCLPQAETTEVELAGKKPFGWAMPLSLNEWKSAASRDGSFDGHTLHLHANGQALYAPLFFDLDIERRKRQRTWRQLTVAHELRINTRDEAVAFRVQIGDEQWAIYRSLAPPENRTFLGHNLITEFLLGRFNKDEGIVDPLIEIE